LGPWRDSMSDKRKRRVRALAAKLNISNEAADNILRAGRDPIVREWRELKRVAVFTLGQRLVMLAMMLKQHNGVAEFSDEELTERVCELEEYLRAKGELAPDEVTRERIRETKLDVHPFVEELRDGLLDHDDREVSAVPKESDAEAVALADDVRRRAWEIVNREFSDVDLAGKLLRAIELLFGGIVGSKTIPGMPEEVIVETFYRGFCNWLYRHRDELLDPSEIEEFVAMVRPG
jgi:hypothetical protein